MGRSVDQGGRELIRTVCICYVLLVFCSSSPSNPASAKIYTYSRSGIPSLTLSSSTLMYRLKSWVHTLLPITTWLPNYGSYMRSDHLTPI